MDKYQISSQYYVVFQDNEVIEQNLPQGITYHQQILNIDIQEKTELHIIYLIKNQTEISIHIQPRVSIDIIETKIPLTKTTFKKEIKIEQDAHVHIFSENLNQHDQIEYNETISLKENAICLCGYAELSQGCVEGKYHYYLDGEGSQAKVRMAVVSQEKEKKHYEVMIQHNVPYTYGQMDNYGVVKENGYLVIDGIGRITKGQHGSSSHQTNKVMVFDENCYAKANPYLYIDDYDVKASHAAAVGKMDEEHLYYLQSRGLTKKQAMQLITYGYLVPVMDMTQNQKVKERVENALLKVGD